MTIAPTAPRFQLLQARPAGIHKHPGILFFDVEDVRGANVVDMCSEELEQQLTVFGFWKVGEIAAQPRAAHENPYTGEDAEEADQYIPNGSKNSVLISEDHTAFAEPEFGHGAHHLRFRTLLESGDIIETRLIPTRRPRSKLREELLEGECGEILDGDEATDIAEDGLASLLEPSDEDAHPSYPRNGFWRKSSREQNVSRLWSIHQKWVQVVQAEVGSPPVKLSNTTQILQITRRAWHITELHSDWSLSGLTWVARSVKLLISLLFCVIAIRCGLEMWFAGPVFAAVLTMNGLYSRVACQPLLFGAIATIGGALTAVWLRQPAFPTAVLICCVWLCDLTVDFTYLVALLRQSSTFSRRLPWPRRVPAREMSAAYPDPLFPANTE